jgi:iron(II)-dependent oxidoreductase
VNRNEYDVDGGRWMFPIAQAFRYFDLYHGVELKPKPGRGKNGAYLFDRSQGLRRGSCGQSPPRPEDSGPDVENERADNDAAGQYSHEWKVVPQKIVPIQPTKAATGTPEGMIKIPGGRFPVQDLRNRD